MGEVAGLRPFGSSRDRAAFLPSPPLFQNALTGIKIYSKIDSSTGPSVSSANPYDMRMYLNGHYLSSYPAPLVEQKSYLNKVAVKTAIHAEGLLRVEGEGGEGGVCGCGIRQKVLPVCHGQIGSACQPLPIQAGLDGATQVDLRLHL